MRNLLFMMSTVLTCAVFATPLRIMPLGDSITYGQGWDPHGGYRAVLREKLVEAGYDIDYVGTQTANAVTRYQWRKNGVDIPGSTGPVYTGTVATPSTEIYTVVAYLDDENYVTSKPAKMMAIPTALEIIIR